MTTLSKNDLRFVELLFAATQSIEDGEWLYSKNENRLCRIFDNPNARTKLRAIHDALVEFLDG